MAAHDVNRVKSLFFWTVKLVSASVDKQKHYTVHGSIENTLHTNHCFKNVNHIKKVTVNHA